VAATPDRVRGTDEEVTVAVPAEGATRIGAARGPGPVVHRAADGPTTTIDADGGDRPGTNRPVVVRRSHQSFASSAVSFQPKQTSGSERPAMREGRIRLSTSTPPSFS